MKRLSRKSRIRGRLFFGIMIVVYFLSIVPFAYIIIQDPSDLGRFLVYFSLAPVLVVAFSFFFLVSALGWEVATGGLETLYSRTRRTFKKYIFVYCSIAILLSVMVCSVLMMEHYRQLIGDGVT